ncbi:hypothetical protein Taro_010301 [Colocasia esculenta]|uniref:Uncharacterized protein n=1 Tax=Colocasia esculenta TaxID=4460 RepID=A0A843UCM1_COLES|nr:hypothetical protein [Colocasia esculenta]
MCTQHVYPSNRLALISFRDIWPYPNRHPADGGADGIATVLIKPFAMVYIRRKATRWAQRQLSLFNSG